jgi:hypothetical protein
VTPTIVEEGASFFPRRGSVSASQKERRDEEARVREEEVKRYIYSPFILNMHLIECFQATHRRRRSLHPRTARR